MFQVTRDVPIGDLTTASNATAPNPKANHVVEVDIPTDEKEVFDIWLRKLWKEKDDNMEQFLETGSFESNTKDVKIAVEIPLKLKRNREILDAFCFFWPAAIAYLRRTICG